MKGTNDPPFASVRLRNSNRPTVPDRFGCQWHRTSRSRPACIASPLKSIHNLCIKRHELIHKATPAKLKFVAHPHPEQVACAHASMPKMRRRAPGMRQPRATSHLARPPRSLGSLAQRQGGGMKIEEEVDGVDGGGDPRPACMPIFAPPTGHRKRSIDRHASRLALK